MGDLEYIQLETPMTFDDILVLWVGEYKHSKIIEYILSCACSDLSPGDFDKCLDLVQEVKSMVENELRSGRIHLYMKTDKAGRAFFLECPLGYRGKSTWLSNTSQEYKDELDKRFPFRTHYQDAMGTMSTPLYFDQSEIFTRFPFLMSPNETGFSFATPPACSSTAPPAEPFQVAFRVASDNKGFSVKLTQEQNTVALEWIAHWKTLEWPQEQIADTLREAGASDAVIGCLLPKGTERLEDLWEMKHDALRKRGARACLS